jgi:PAS domain S-box-containing protein
MALSEEPPSLDVESLLAAERRARLGGEHARRHLSLIAETSKILAPSLEEYESAVEALADTLVPEFADWCMLELTGNDRPGRLGCRQGPGLAQDVAGALGAFPGWGRLIERVMGSGRPELQPAPARTRTVRVLKDQDFLDAGRAVGLVSWMVAPIRIRGLSLGVLAMGGGPDRRGFRPSDLDAATEVASRVAIAIERVLLYRQTLVAADQARRQADQLARLVEAAVLIDSAGSPQAVLDAAADQARAVTGAARAIVIVDDVTSRSAVHPSVAEPGNSGGGGELGERWITVLIPVAGAPDAGVLRVLSQPGRRIDEDESILRLLARSVGVALENARLYQAVHQSRERLGAVIEAAPVAIIELDADGPIRRWGPATDVIFAARDTDGASSGEREAAFHPDAVAQLDAVRRRVLETGSPQSTTIHTFRQDGTPVELSGSAAPLRGAGGDATGVLAVLTDMTEWRMLEHQLQQGQRMEAIGRLAGGVAHDFNNLLTVITGYALFSLEGMAEDDSMREPLQAIQQAALRAARLTEQLLTISRRQVVQPVVLDISAIVSDLDAILRRLIGEHIQLRTTLGSSPVRVRIDRGQLEQVILNLVLNARDAMPSGGRLDVTIGSADATEGDGAPGVGPCATVAVRDTGTGMDAATVQRCFDPFFTTKGHGEGTGLGLATVYGVVSQAGGRITVQSRVGSGTEFMVWLPTVDDPLSPQPLPVSVDDVAADETVLVVEDDESVRALLRDVLTTHGYRVLEASTGAAALELVAGHHGPLDLLISDVVMPGMSGTSLAEEIDRIRPGLPVLFLSGYDAEASLSGRRSADFLAKPVRPDDLLHKARDMLTRVEPQG